jgi:hypothetical protein
MKRSAALYIFSGQNTSAAEIHGQLVEVCGDSVMDHQDVAKWCRLFADGRVDVHDSDRSGKPSTSKMECSAAHIDELIKETDE